MPGLGGALVGAEESIGTSHVETRDAAKNPSVHLAAPRSRDFSLRKRQQWGWTPRSPGVGGEVKTHRWGGGRREGVEGSGLGSETSSSLYLLR